MFFDCLGLKYLELPNFLTTRINTLSQMFGCSTSLKYLNLKLFKKEVESTWNIEKIFEIVPEDAIICIDDNNTKHYLLDPESHRMPYVLFRNL